MTGRTWGAVSKWIERHALPLADGPVVHGLPTWRNRTFLAWAYANDYLVTRGGQRLPLWERGKQDYESMQAKGMAHTVTPVRELRARGELPDT